MGWTFYSYWIETHDWVLLHSLKQIKSKNKVDLSANKQTKCGYFFFSNDFAIIFIDSIFFSFYL